MTRTAERAWRNTDQHTVKQKTLAPKKIPPFRIRFPTGDVASKYEVYTSKRNLFMERGFTCSESNQLELPDTVARVIKAHKWESFCQNPSPASIPLVREFYANYDPDNPDLVRVRGKLVDASVSAINSLYFLTDHQSSFFEAGSKVSPPAMRDIVEELTGKRVTSKKAKNIYISWGDLKAGQDIWVKFIKSNLLPTPCSTAISKDRAILLYCIMVGKPINVGKVIAKQIQKCASLKSGDLWFPSLITRLCERHYVLPSSCEPVQQPYPPLLLDELVESKSDQQTYPSNKKTSLSDHNPSFPVASTSHHNDPSLFGSSCRSPLPTPQATSSQPLPPVVPSAPSAEPSSPPKYNYNEVTSPLPTTPATSSQQVPPVTPSARAAEPSSPPQTELDELPIGLNTAKTKERAWINTGNQKKKQKTTTQGSISTGNPQPLERIRPFRRFPTAAAVKKYQVYTRKRNLFMERGFACSKSNQLELPHIFARVIKAHKWETFCQNPSPASIPLVREFYANYDAARPNLVHVRGRLVDASPSAINSIFSLTNHQNTLFDDVSNVSPLAMSDIVDALTRRKVIEYDRPFSRSDLKNGSEIWINFTKHNLFPCCLEFMVDKELAILLYCVMAGKPINVGKVIAKHIRKCASLTSGALWFPALITRLCEQHNVLPAFREPIQQPYSPLPVGFVERRVNYEPVESKHDQQTNLSNQQTSHSDHDPSFPVANTGHQSRDELGSGPNLPVPAEATENAPPHFDSYQQSPPPTAQATSSQPPPPVAPLAPPAELSCLPQTESDKLPAYFQIHVPGLPILAEAAENAPPHFDSSQQSPPSTAQATSSQSLPPVAPSVLPAEPLSPPQTDSVELQIGLNTAKTKERAWINTENQKKKQKTATQGSISTGNPQPLDRIPPFQFRFPTGDAVEKYEVYTRTRSLFMERGFTCSESNQLELPHTVTRVIKAHKWETFCQNPSPASIPLVREFYANYDAARPNLVHVRGKLVDASPSAINSIFSLTNHQSTLFDDVYNVSPLAMRDIVDELTRRKVIYYNRPFYQYELKEGPKIWLSFTKHNLFPCWDNFVGKELAILLYCIMVGKPINVGKVIAKQIRKCAGLTSGALWFPALITRLCEQHNVLPAFREPIQQPYSPLPVGFVERRVNYEPVESKHDQQTNLSNQQTSHSDHDPLFPVANTGHQSRDELGSGPNLPVPAEATENAPPHFDSYQQSPPPTAQATSSQPPPPVAPLAPPAELSCLPQTESDKLPAYFQIHVPGLPILAEAAENAPPHFDSSQQSPPSTAQATSSQSLPPVAPSVLPAEPLSPPQTDSVELQIGSNTAKTKDWINTENQKKKQKTTTQGSISTGNPQPLERIPPFRFRFPTAGAVEKYEVYTRKRNLFMERGFTCSESNQLELPHTVTRVIKAHKWETFCQNPSPASIPLVREFYANYDPDNPDLVRVRGKLVDASPSAINSIFSLTNHQSTLFDDVSNVSPLAMCDIMDELTIRKVYYMPSYQYYLKKGPKIWLSFTKHNLFPCWNNLVGKELAILLYCIMVGKPINVGKVIAKQIGKCASLKSGGLLFPALITRLCEQHNVLPAFSEPIQQPYSRLPVDVERTVNYEPVESEHDQQTNLSNQQTSHSDHDPLFPIANTGHQSCSEFGSAPNLPVPAEATENAPPHFDSYQQSPPPTAQATSSQPPPPVAPLAPPAKLSCLPQTDSDKLPIHVLGLPILAEAAENAPPHFDSSQQSPPPTAQATSLQSLPPIAPSVLPAEPLSPPQTDSVKLQVSSPQCGTICVQGYSVKRSVAPILEAIFKKHGDIAAECLFKTASARSYFLEVVCEVVTRIETDDVIEKMEEIECQVSDAEATNINVSWLRAHLEAVHKRKEAMKRSDLLMETKVNTSLVKRAAQMDLRESCEELMTAQERFEKAERCARVLHLVEKNIKNTILETKAENDLWVKRRVL